MAMQTRWRPTAADNMPAFGDVTGAYLDLHKLQRGTKRCAERNRKLLT
jgi:hypothetical protein